jgi:DNA-directed RNA polymerase subunit H (RpoH/RPB5)
MLAQAFKIADEMLTDRGYTKNVLLNGNENRKIYYNDTSRVLFEYIDDPKIGVANFKTFLSTLEEYNSKNSNYKVAEAILIVNEKPSASVRKLADSIKDYIKVTFFVVSQFQFNVTKNTLVPNHKKLTGSKLIEFKEDLQVDSIEELTNIMPKIDINDPQCAYWGFSIGDIIKIKRTFPTNEIYYRIVTF